MVDGVLAELTASFAKPGRVEWIGVRTQRRGPVSELEEVFAASEGLVGDHRNKPGKRTVTFVQYEHLAVIASLAGLDNVAPARLRRNIVVSGINLLGLRNKSFWIGEAVFLGSGLCAPCSRMEEELGFGGYTAMRGHGGITASVEHPGLVSIGDAVSTALE